MYKRYASWPALYKQLLRVLSVVFALYTVAFLFFYLASSLYNSVVFSGFAADGPFQLYNPLRRLEAGQLVGRDFQFFHGPAIPLLYFPMFHFLGSNVFASEFSRWMLGAVAFLISAFAFFFIAFRSKWRALLACAVTLLITNQFLEVVFPSNSLIGIRTTMPVLFGAFYLLPDFPFKFWRFHLNAKSLLLGLMAALAYLLGTEQGIAIAAAYVLVEAWRLRKQLRIYLINLVQFGAMAVTSLVGILSAITGDHAYTALKYAMVDVAGDQSWYFGAEPQGFLTWHNFYHKLFQPFLLLTYVITIIVLYALIKLHRAAVITSRQAWCSMVLLAYGVIAYVFPALGGYFATGQAISLLRVVLLIAVMLAGFTMLAFAPSARPSKKKGEKPGLNKYVLASCSMFFAVLIGTAVIKTVAYTSQTYRLNLSSLLKTARIDRHSDDYAAAAPGWKESLDSFRFATTSNKTLWGLYSSLYESDAHRFNPSKSGADYIIHALGPERRNAYEEQFLAAKPYYVITLRQSYFPYEEWVWDRHWPIYQDLLANYTIIKVNSSHYLWQRNNTPAAPKPAWQVLKPTPDNKYRLPAPDQTSVIYEVTITYRAKNILPFTKTLPKYLIGLNNSGNAYSISLPPYETSWSFPVTYYKENGPVTLNPHVDGLFPGKLTVIQLLYRAVPVSHQNSQIFNEDDCYQYNPGKGSFHWRKTPYCEDFRAHVFSSVN